MLSNWIFLFLIFSMNKLSIKIIFVQEKKTYKLLFFHFDMHLHRNILNSIKLNKNLKLCRLLKRSSYNHCMMHDDVQKA